MQRFNYIRRFSELGIDDVPLVGGKNASLGEMYQALTGKGVRVPNGFATTAQAFRDYLEHNDLKDRIGGALAALKPKGDAIRDPQAHVAFDVDSMIKDLGYIE